MAEIADFDLNRTKRRKTKKVEHKTQAPMVFTAVSNPATAQSQVRNGINVMVYVLNLVNKW